MSSVWLTVHYKPLACWLSRRWEHWQKASSRHRAQDPSHHFMGRLLPPRWGSSAWAHLDWYVTVANVDSRYSHEVNLDLHSPILINLVHIHPPTPKKNHTHKKKNNRYIAAVIDGILQNKVTWTVKGGIYTERKETDFVCIFQVVFHTFVSWLFFDQTSLSFQLVYVVVDTNVLIGSLKFVQDLRDMTLKGQFCLRELQYAWS